MATTSPTINLLKGKEKNLIDKIITWALTVGRLVVILTEIVALGAFLYRFTLDRQIIDLRGEIKNKESIVRLLQTNESKYRSLQDRLLQAGQLDKRSKQQVDTLQSILNTAPAGIIFNTITMTEKEVRLDINTPSVVSLSTLIASLKKHPAVRFVSIDKIENKPSNATVAVSIGVGLKQQ